MTKDTKMFDMGPEHEDVTVGCDCVCAYCGSIED